MGIEAKLNKVKRQIRKVLADLKGWKVHRMVMGYGFRIEHKDPAMRQRIATRLAWSNVDGDTNLDRRAVYVCVLP